MRVTKKGAVCAVLAAAAVFLFAGLCVPKRTHVEKVLPCTEEGQTEPVTAEIRGTYYAYLLRDDVFNGVVEIQGKRQETGRFTLFKDTCTSFHDAYGQPEGVILQFKEFSYISVADSGYVISSEWDAGWKEESERKQKWNNTLKEIRNLFFKET